MVRLVVVVRRVVVELVERRLVVVVVVRLVVVRRVVRLVVVARLVVDLVVVVAWLVVDLMVVVARLVVGLVERRLVVVARLVVVRLVVVAWLVVVRLVVVARLVVVVTTRRSAPSDEPNREDLRPACRGSKDGPLRRAFLLETAAVARSDSAPASAWHYTALCGIVKSLLNQAHVREATDNSDRS